MGNATATANLLERPRTKKRAMAASDGAKARTAHARRDHEPRRKAPIEARAPEIAPAVSAAGGLADRVGRPARRLTARRWSQPQRSANAQRGRRRGPSGADQTVGGEVLGALARTNERPGRGAGAPARRRIAGGGENRTANLNTRDCALVRNENTTPQWSCPAGAEASDPASASFATGARAAETS